MGCFSGWWRMRHRMGSMRRAQSISRCTDWLAEASAQATVEAAILLPSFLTVLLLALQPVCLLYTRAVMESAAAETARVAATYEGEEGDALRGFALRRLEAVPDLEIFHTGGMEGWHIDASGAGGTVRVEIQGWVSPLPVLGAFVGVFGERNPQGDVSLRVEVEYDARAEWVSGGYDDWTA